MPMTDKEIKHYKERYTKMSDYGLFEEDKNSSLCIEFPDQEWAQTKQRLLHEEVNKRNWRDNPKPNLYYLTIAGNKFVEDYTLPSLRSLLMTGVNPGDIYVVTHTKEEEDFLRKHISSPIN